MSSKLEIAHDNVLQYEGRTLWADVLRLPFRGPKRNEFSTVSPGELETILRVGHSAVEYAIEVFYKEQHDRLAPHGYTITRPSLWIAQLGNSRQTDGRDSQVYSEKGYANGGVHFDADEQRPIFFDHWHAVEQAGFVPHVRGSMNGAWLMLRNDHER